MVCTLKLTIVCGLYPLADGCPWHVLLKADGCLWYVLESEWLFMVGTRKLIVVARKQMVVRGMCPQADDYSWFVPASL